MLLLEEDPAYPKISLSLLYFETCSVLCSLAFIPFPTALMEKLGRWCSFIILKKTKLFLIKPIFKSLWQFLRRRFQVHPVLILFLWTFKMHLARAEFCIFLFEVDLRFRKIDQRGLKTSRIYETLKAFFFQKYLWSANLFWRKFHWEHFSKARFWMRIAAILPLRHFSWNWRGWSSTKELGSA